MEEFQQILPITKAKRDLLDIVKHMEEEEETIAITKNGVPVGVMMCLSRYEALLELIEILGDKEIVKRKWEDIDALGYVYIWQCLLSF